MDLARAVADVLLGASLQQLAAEYREGLLTEFGFRADEVTPDTFRDEVASFMRKLARHLGDHHAGDPRVGQALREWIHRCDHYEAWDALLSGFQVEGRDALVRRGRMLFPGSLTAHWAES
jgi:hypothetical protein